MATDAQRRAVRKWDAEKNDIIKLRVPKGEKKVISNYAKSCGESSNAFIYRAVKEAMERDQQK